MKKITKLLMLGLLSTSLFVTSCGEDSGNTDVDPSNPSLPDSDDKEKIDINEDEDRKIYYTVNITIESLDLNSVISSMGTKVRSYNGRIENSYIYYDDAGKASNGTYTYRIPTENLNNFLNDVDENFDVKSEQITSTDATSSYNQAAARVEVLEASRESYIKILEDDNLTINEIISIQNKIESIDTELAYLHKQLNTYDDLVLYSTIIVKYTTKYIPVNESFFEQWIEYVGNFFVFLFKLIMYLLPFAFVAGLVVGTIFLIRYLNKKRKNKKEVIKK